MANKTIKMCLTLAIAALLAGPALAQSTGKNAADACKGIDKASKAYSDCVKAQAQTTKDAKPATTTQKAGGKPAKN